MMRTNITALCGNRINLYQLDLHPTFQYRLHEVEFSEMVVKVGQDSCLKVAENSNFPSLGRIRITLMIGRQSVLSL